jgi:cell division protein FtsW
MIAMFLLGLVTLLLIAQPDLGQTILVATTWGAIFFLAGMPWIWIAVIAGAAGVGMVAAYSTFPHVATRIDQFLNPENGDTYQVDTALEAFINGGWAGVGPGEGTVKLVLPDAHADFIFAVAAEEFGIVVCLALVAVFGFVVIRGLARSLRCEDPFARVAAAGLMVLFGTQSVINMAVNLNLMPSKGMTLPFISYGGSSMFAIAIGMGLVLALTRQSPSAERRRRRVMVEGLPDTA